MDTFNWQKSWILKWWAAWSYTPKDAKAEGNAAAALLSEHGIHEAEAKQALEHFIAQGGKYRPKLPEIIEHAKRQRVPESLITGKCGYCSGSGWVKAPDREIGEMRYRMVKSCVCVSPSMRDARMRKASA